MTELLKMMANGYSAEDLRKAGYTLTEMRMAGIGAKELRRAGYSAGELRNEGFLIKELKKAGYTAAEMKEAIKKEKLTNDAPDVKWLSDVLSSSNFDLYVVHDEKDEEGEDKMFCFGVTQCKTSLRDRVTRDYSNSKTAMAHFFWSTCVTLNTKGLIAKTEGKKTEFEYMIMGGDPAKQFDINGYHAFYAISESKSGRYKETRIYYTDTGLDIVREHATKALMICKDQRRRFMDHNYSHEKEYRKQCPMY